MKILVCGSRDWDDADVIEQVLLRVWRPFEQTVIHGAARGADKIAGQIADRLGYRVQEFPAHWRPGGVYNPGAGFERNLTMLREEPDIVLAFQKNGSTGTQHTINEARKRGIPVEVYRA